MSLDALSASIIEFLDSGKFKLAMVMGKAKGKLQVRDLNGKQHKVGERQILVAHSDSSQEVSDQKIKELEEQIQSVVEELDTELLWESVSDDLQEQNLEKLTESYFGSQSSVEQSAILRATFSDPVHFKVKGKSVTPRSPEQVEEQIRILKKREEKRRHKAKGIAWLEEIFNRDSYSGSFPDDLIDLIRAYETFIWENKDHASLQWLREVENAPRGQELKRTVIEVLKHAGRIDPDADQRLLLAGIREDFSEPLQALAEGIDAFKDFPSEREDFRTLQSFSIDDPETEDIDDAISFEELEEGYRLGIHIADVAHFVEKDSPLDHEAHRRGASIYLPHLRVPMFPRRLSSNLTSLVAKEDRPSMSLIVELDQKLNIESWRFTRAAVHVQHRLNYEEADARIDGEPGDVLDRYLKKIFEFTQSLEAQRGEKGALLFNRNELKVQVVEEQVEVSVVDGDSPSRAMVSELMVLMNSFAALYCRENEIPCLFRTQDAPEENIDIPEDYDPIRMDQIFRSLKRSRVTLHAGTHAGLGLKEYTQITSPIRRYQDLAVQRQMVAHMAGEDLPYTDQELLQILTTVQMVEGENRHLEREATQFYTYLFIQRELQDQSLPAIVVNQLTGAFLIELTEWFIRGKLVTPQSLELGDEVQVQVRDVIPEEEVLVFELM